MSMNLKVDEVLCNSEGLYLQLRNCCSLPMILHNLLALSSTSSSANPFCPSIPSDTAPSDSNRSTPEKLGNKMKSSVATGNHEPQTLYVNSSTTEAAQNGEALTDDSSIEILSDGQADVAF